MPISPNRRTQTDRVFETPQCSKEPLLAKEKQVSEHASKRSRTQSNTEDQLFNTDSDSQCGSLPSEEGAGLELKNAAEHKLKSQYVNPLATFTYDQHVKHQRFRSETFEYQTVEQIPVIIESENTNRKSLPKQ